MEDKSGILITDVFYGLLQQIKLCEWEIFLQTELAVHMTKKSTNKQISYCNLTMCWQWSLPSHQGNVFGCCETLQKNKLVERLKKTRNTKVNIAPLQNITHTDRNPIRLDGWRQCLDLIGTTASPTWLHKLLPIPRYSEGNFIRQFSYLGLRMYASERVSADKTISSCMRTYEYANELVSANDRIDLQ